jgi:Phage tail tube protein
VTANPNPTYASFLGVTLEANFGAGGTPTMFIPVKTMTPADQLTWLEDEGWRGAPLKTYGGTAGPVWAEYEYGGDVFADSIMYPAMGVLGDITVTGTATGSGATTLSSTAAVAATSLSTAASITSGTIIQIGTGATAEIATTGAPTGSGPYTIPLANGYALKYQHTSSSAVTPVTVPYTTIGATLCSGNFQPPSYCLTDWNSNITGYQLAGAKYSELGLKFSGNGKLEYSTKATVLSNTVNATKPSYVNTPTSIMAGWSGIVKLGGTTVGYLVDGETNVKRNVEVIDAADGTQSPYYLFSGEVESDGKMTIVMESDTWRANFVAGTTTSVDVNYAAGTGTTATQVKTHQSTCRITDAKVSRGKSYAELELTYTADGNTTDVGPSGGFGSVTIQTMSANSVGTYK